MRDTEIRFSVLESSRGRFWHGFNATVYSATPGFDETLCANHSVSMHVGAPVIVTSRCDGEILHRLQVPGDIKIVPAGFSRIWEIESPARKVTINVSRALIQTAADAMGIDGERVSIAPQLHLRDPQIEHILWALKNELETDEPMGRVYAESLGLALASHLIRKYARVAPCRADGGLSKRRLKRVLEYVDEHMSEDLSLVGLADVVNVSPSHFNVLFKQAVGLPVHQYVIRRRVERAIHLLLNDRLQLSEVALRAGFASQSHMAACMQRIAGVTPGSLRRSAM
jgi:AraC family transcriptional regulator